jgi:hypothetical protein
MEILPPVKSSSRTISGLQWFYHAKGENSLEDTSVDPLKQIIVCWDCPGKLMGNYKDPDATFRMYHAFEYIDFFRFHDRTKEEHRCFFEIILGEIRQKPKFDLDIPGKVPEKEVVASFNLFVSVLVFIFNKLYKVDLIPEKDLLLYTSHGAEKYSFHIIINNYCHESHKHARLLYDAVASKMKEDKEEAIIPDQAVYSSFQQFRILGSRKYGTGRVKTFQEKWKWGDREISFQYPHIYENTNQKNVIDFLNSFVSHTSNCVNLYETAIIPPVLKSLPCSITLDTSEVCSILDMCRSDPAFRGSFPFSLLKCQDSFLILKRQSKSFCPICTRDHEHENPFIYVKQDGNIYFDCRRSGKETKIEDGVIVSRSKYHHVGKIKRETPPDSEVVEFSDNCETTETPVKTKSPKSSKIYHDENGLPFKYRKSASKNREISVQIDIGEVETPTLSFPPIPVVSIEDIETFDLSLLPPPPIQKKKKKQVDKEIYLHRKRLLRPEQIMLMGVGVPERNEDIFFFQ